MLAMSAVTLYSLLIPLAFFLIYFFKQTTAYEIRISDWSSDVCSSDLQDAIKTLVRNIDLREVGTTFHMIQHIVPDECVKLVLAHIARHSRSEERPVG